MKRVLLDVDGVLADFVGPVLDVIYDVTGRTFRHEDVTTCDFAACLGLSADEKRWVANAISNEPGWWSSLPVLPGAHEGVAELQQIADVYIVTSPWDGCRTWLHERKEWLRRHFGINKRRVFSLDEKHFVSGDILIDDKTENVRAWAEAHPCALAVQWRTPHNRLDGWTGASTRSWEQLVEWAR
ncbi:MAG: 5' nucleotidase, NT5C type [Kofleriaceae bacterium]